MSNNSIKLLENNSLRALELTSAAVKSCTDELWCKTAGGYPVWQQIYHSVACSYIFLRLPDEKDIRDMPVGIERARLLVISDRCEMTRKEMIKYIEETITFTSNFFSRCDDTLLDKTFPHREGFTYGQMLSRAEAHLFYHLGGLDTILRENGLKAAW